jgi:chromosomal replication initiator protein
MRLSTAPHLLFFKMWKTHLKSLGIFYDYFVDRSWLWINDTFEYTQQYMLEGKSTQSVWSAVLGELEVGLSDGTFNAWFKSTSLLAVEGSVATIGVINVFAKKQLEEKFSDTLLRALRQHNLDVDSIVYKITSVSSEPSTEGLFDVADQPNVSSPRRSKSRTSIDQNTSGLNPRYTFESFIVGGGNELAHAACQAVARDPGGKYNPLFIYGDVGLGKTHLMQAVGNEIARRDPSKEILYTTSEKFINEFVDSIRFKRIFSKKYRTADVLIVDDMQFIAGKEKTQIEFFHTFNDLHQTNKQIILSSDRAPRSIPTLEDRLRSRFEWGMTIDIQAPDLETRLAILQVKAADAGVALPNETAEYLAARQSENVRELEGTLNQFLAQAELLKREPSLELAEQIFADSLPPRRRLTAKVVVEQAARYFQIDSKLILGSTRKKEVVLPRQVAMYLLRSELHFSFPQVAEALGRKDHTTAMHSVSKIERQLNEQASLRVQVNELKELLYAR